MRRASRIVGLVSVVTLALGGLAVGSATAGTGSLELVATGWSAGSVSADGSRAAFVSDADGQVYARDLVTGVDTLVSTADGTTPATGFHQSRNPEISRNGRFITFTTLAQNLSTLDTDFLQDVYLKDLATGILTLVSTNGAGQKGNLPSSGPAPVSDNGTVVFSSQAGNFPPLTPLPSDCFPGESFCMESEIYAKSLSGTLTLVSLGTRGDYMDAASGSLFADISADGTTVALGTVDPLTPDDTDLFGGPDVFVVDLTTGARVLASDATGGFYFPSLSADGSRVAFQGSVIGPEPLINQVFVRDLAASTQVLVSETSDGQAANDVAQDASLSGDGQFIAFSSRATNLHPDDPDAADDVYLKSLETGELRLVSQRDDGTKGSDGGAQPVQAYDGGTGVFFSAFLRTFDPTVTTFDFGWYLKRLSPAGPVDGNGDGIVDSLQPAGTSAGAFVDASTTPSTSGRVVDTGGLSVTVADAQDAADGVLVTVGPAGAGSPLATLSACGITLRLSPGSTVVLTCGSVIVKTITGSVRAELDNGVIVVVVPAGTSARISDTAAGAQVSEVLGTGVTVAVNGATTPLAPGGATVAFTSRVVSGFKAPVDNPPVLNSVKSGRAIPLKWHVDDASGAPVTNLTTATVSVQNLSCGRTATTDEIEQTFAGSSGLQNLGNGDYQLNWKTSSAWANSCKTMVLDLGGGVTVRADFTFTR